MQFEANREPIAGMSDLLTSMEMHRVLEGVGESIARIARGIGPRKSGFYVSQIEVQDGGRVNIGRYQRTSVAVVAKAPYSAVIEAREQVLTRATEAVANGAA